MSARFGPLAGGLVKICGLSTPESIEVAAVAGANMLGLVFFPKSPRHVDVDRAADLAVLARRLAPGVAIVALTVDATDADLSAIADGVAPDWFQLHGAETPHRVAEVRRLFGVPVIKAVGIADDADVAEANRYAGAADRLLLDAKPTPGALLPGGNGVTFDHRLIAGRDFGLPWLLSGGLTPDNVAEAIELTRPGGVDVSSGVESVPGVKDHARIRAFVAAAREALDSAAQ